MIKWKTKISELFKIEYPIIQGGMVWVSGWKLASAVSNNGGLGLIGSGSMKPELLKEHITKCFDATKKPFGVNIPLMREDAEELVNVVLEEGVKIVFTSAGNPKTFTKYLKQNNVTVVHVVPSVKFGLKAEAAGCDAVVGEGVEAGGHNGYDELSTMVLIPQLVDALKVPVIAAGGIGDGRAILAALSLGAQAVQIGTRFAATEESSAHIKFKRRIVEAVDNDTVLALKKIGMVRMLKNEFAKQAIKATEEGWSAEQQSELLGKKRAMLGIFEGDEKKGELEAGQISGLIKEILPVKDVIKNLSKETEEAYNKIKTKIKF